MRLSNKIALVTGGAGGLGSAICKRLASEGATVVVNDFCDESRINAVVEEILKNGGKAVAKRASVADSEQVKQMFSEVKAEFGGLHVLFNNAAITPEKPDDEARRAKHYTYISTPVPRQSLEFTSRMTDADWFRFWDVNVHGVFFCTREALNIMESQREGRIINIASVAGFCPISSHSPHYSATKGAVIAFTKSVAAEVAGSNVFVNAMAPGGILTPAFSRYMEQAGEEGRSRLAQMIPLGRLGTPEEYAETALHLAETKYLIGQIISPNGGVAI
ncbi:MAG: SDR family NAD(P)-dependent oxidoreductase [Comamonas sp.]|uniref:SDR family NAD(P)-dependent oxidoreductase n=1 Tax=Comamonas sp. TaxID=34028 RepID=UPI002FCC2CE5